MVSVATPPFLSAIEVSPVPWTLHTAARARVIGIDLVGSRCVPVGSVCRRSIAA
jgi:hypothetical protein